MTDYKAIFGKKIKFLTTDLSATEGEGEIFYSDSAKEFKVGVTTAAWSAGSVMIAGKTEGGSLPTSPSTAGLAGGGSNPAGWTGAVNTTYSWDGNGWSSEPNMNVARDGVRGNGTSTSALFVGGIRPPAATYSNESESWNGSSWTAETAHPQAINQSSVAGTETAAVVAGGYDYVAAPSTGGRTRETFEYDGSSWTAGNNKPFGASNMGSAGIQTASIFFGGFGQPGDGTAPSSPSSNPLSSAEEYDGTNWTTVGSLNTARYGVTGSGVQSDAGAIGGYPAITNFERWDGSSWTNSSTLGTGRQTGFAGGSPASTDGAFIGGGQTPPIVATTEKFHSSALAYTAAAWASGGDLTQVRSECGGTGTQTAGFVTGGYKGSDPGGQLAKCETYDGSSWTEVGDLNTARWSNNAAGTQTATICFGGYDGSSIVGVVETWDGSSWTEVGDLNTARYDSGRAGTSTAALAFGGNSGSGTTVNESWDGSSWTEGPDMNTARWQGGTGGTQTAALFAAGQPGASTNVEEFDGTSWTEVNDCSTERYGVGQAGTQTDSIIYGGELGPSEPKAANTEAYDGTTWSTRPSLATARSAGSSGDGTSTAAFLAGGNVPGPNPTRRVTTEEFTGETTALNLKTITDS